MRNGEPVKTILLTGATGYVGGRLLRALEAKEFPVRCLVRRVQYAHPSGSDRTEVVQGDVLDYDSLRSALTDVDVAYYLVLNLWPNETSVFVLVFWGCL